MRKLLNLITNSHAISAIFAFAVAVVLFLIPASRRFEDELARRIEFNTREALGQSPSIDQRIKVFAYDDKTAASELSQENVALSDWALIIKSLAANRPDRIVFDKMFTFPDKDPTQNQLFVTAVKNTGVKVYAAAFATTTKLNERQELPIVENCLPEKDQPHWKNLVSDQWHFYGPATAIADAFAGLGHIVIDDQSRYPLAYATKNGSCMPFLTAAVSNDYSILPYGIRIGKKTIKADPDGGLQPNIVPRTNFYRKVYSLKTVIQIARKNEAVPVIQEGDTVIVLPSMYTGNTDFKTTPLGVMEGGFFHVANLNSMLSGNWLQFAGYDTLPALTLLLGASLLGSLVIQTLSPAMAFIATLATLGLGFTLAIGSFLGAGIMAFWLLPLVTFLTAMLGGIIEKAASLEQHARKVSMALEGLVPQHVIKTLKKNPAALHLSPKKIHASIMFIDVEGFSVRFEGVDPDVIFSGLQKQLQRLGALVHEHGGIIDKTLGDGLLAFFGHSYDVSEPASELPHAIQALQCANAIQREWAERMTHNGKFDIADPKYAELIPMPLRIGINVGDVYLGNLGSGDRVDFTIVGDPVNFAKRLEDSANSFRVMIGASVKEQLERASTAEIFSSQGLSLRKCMLQIKHHSELIEAWECDPFANNFLLLRNALGVARGQVKRTTDRDLWILDTPLEIVLNGTQPGRLLDFSPHGLCIETSTYFARKVQVTIELAINDSEIHAILIQQGLATLLTEVRWGAEVNGKIRHGLRILNLAKTQRESLHQTLVSCLKNDEKKITHSQP
jgi:class 3 adenylate cyclase